MCTSPLRKRGSLLQSQTGCVVKKTEDWWHPIRRAWPQLSVHGRPLGWGCPNEGVITKSELPIATLPLPLLQRFNFSCTEMGKKPRHFFLFRFIFRPKSSLTAIRVSPFAGRVGQVPRSQASLPWEPTVSVRKTCFKCSTVLFTHVSRRTFPNKLEGVFVMFIGWGYLKIRSEENIYTQGGERKQQKDGGNHVMRNFVISSLHCILGLLECSDQGPDTVSLSQYWSPIVPPLLVHPGVSCVYYPPYSSHSGLIETLAHLEDVRHRFEDNIKIDSVKYVYAYTLSNCLMIGTNVNTVLSCERWG